jgi:hypothetical protein
LGHVSKDNMVRCTNSFAVLYRSQPSWFLGHNYVDDMMDMFHKVNVREKNIGWCSTGPIVPPTDLGIPTEAYISVDEPREDGAVVPFIAHLPSEINAADAEEVGVGH